MPSQAWLRDFDTNWTGEPSPQLTDPTAPLPDGIYSARFLTQDPAALTVEIYRFQLCSVLGDTLCSPGPATDLGVADTADRTLVVPLDTTTRFVIMGWECDEDRTRQGNGADMAALYSALATDYNEVFTTRLAAGGDPFEIQNEVRATPGLPFEPTPSTCDDGLSLLWRFGDAPPVLVQSPFADDPVGPRVPASLLRPTAVQVDGAVTTVFLYAGYYS